jgi:hypothetical protein
MSYQKDLNPYQKFQQNKKEQVQNLKNQHKNEKDTLNLQFSSEINELNKKFEAAKGLLLLENEEKIRNLKKKHTEEIEQLDAEIGEYVKKEKPTKRKREYEEDYDVKRSRIDFATLDEAQKSELKSQMIDSLINQSTTSDNSSNESDDLIFGKKEQSQVANNGKIYLEKCKRLENNRSISNYIKKMLKNEIDSVSENQQVSELLSEEEKQNDSNKYKEKNDLFLSKKEQSKRPNNKNINLAECKTLENNIKKMNEKDDNFECKVLSEHKTEADQEAEFTDEKNESDLDFDNDEEKENN